MRPHQPLRGQVWDVDFRPVRGHEQGETRPALVLSSSQFNLGPTGLAVVVPLTTRIRGLPLHYEVSPPEGGLTADSTILCDQIRAFSLDRFQRYRGQVEQETLDQVEYRVKVLLEFR